MSEEIKEVKPEVESSTPPENAPSPEVKSEEPEATKSVVEEPEPVEANKDKEQISNLNIALKQERDARKASDEKVANLETNMKESSDTIDRLKQVFTPKEEKEIKDETQYMTAEKADELFKQKFEERTKEDEKEKQLGLIKEEIKTLEKEFDGKEGKPKYDDQEILTWQKEHNKLHLTPKEAFDSMKGSEILDWKVKEKLSNKKEVAEVEKPGSGQELHAPAEFIPTNETETREAILEAMEASEKEI